MFWLSDRRDNFPAVIVNEYRLYKFAGSFTDQADKFCAGVKYKPDIHTRLMQRYTDIPSWWFLALLIGNIAVSFFMMEWWKDTFQLERVALLLALVLTFAFTLPMAVITATTNQVRL
jgi:hypothetical protein